VKVVQCEQCACKYGYQAVRRAVGSGSSLYFLDNDGANSRAKNSARKQLAKKLARAVDPVGCPKCGWFQPEMVREIRRRTARGLIWFAWISLIVFGVPAVGILLIHRGGVSSALGAWFSSLASLAILLPGCCFAMRFALQRVKYPNRAQSDSGALFPDAPRAILLSDAEFAAGELPSLDGGESTDRPMPTDPSTLSEISPGGFVAVQLAAMEFPYLCCGCCQPAHEMHRFKYRALVYVPVRICSGCFATYRAKRVMWGIIFGVVGFLPLAIYSVTLGDISEMITYAIGAAVCGVIVGAIASNIVRRVLFPVQMLAFSRERNTLRLRFRTPGYLKQFLAANAMNSPLGPGLTKNRPVYFSITEKSTEVG
jgi:hypothetical protein